jgi:SAM-dependent methyltransferase
VDESRWRERAGSFGAAATVYDRSRPSYPVDAVRWALPDGAQRVLDLGAGTGKLTSVLLDLGLDVVAVEPSPGMRALLPARAQVLEGTAEQIPLPDGCVDAVLAAQAFHWFDLDRALPEIARVLRPGGTLGVLWNERDESVPWVRAVWDLWGGEPERVVGEVQLTGTARLAPPERRVFRHEQLLDADLLVDLVASRSALITMPEDERVEVLQRVRELAPQQEPFALPYELEVWRSQLLRS